MSTPTPRRLYAPLMAALFLCLQGCSHDSTRPELPHWAIPDAPPKHGDPGAAAEPAPKPLPPRLDCRQPRPADSELPPHPRTGDDVAWTIWAARVYGYARLWIDKDKAEITCEQDLRRRGVVR